MSTKSSWLTLHLIAKGWFFPPNIRNMQISPFSSLSFNKVLEAIVGTIRYEKEINGKLIQKEKKKHSFYRWHHCLHRKFQGILKKILELNELNQFPGYKIYLLKNYKYKLLNTEIRNIIPFIFFKNIKFLGVNLTKYMSDYMPQTSQCWSSHYELGIRLQWLRLLQRCRFNPWPGTGG